MAAIGGNVPFVFNLDWLLLILAVGCLYAAGLIVLRRRGLTHPPPRIAAFYGGLAALLVAFVSPLDNYDAVSLFAHMAQHLLLMFGVAPLIALGAPITVLLGALPARAGRQVLGALQSA